MNGLEGIKSINAERARKQHMDKLISEGETQQRAFQLSCDWIAEQDRKFEKNMRQSLAQPR